MVQGAVVRHANYGIGTIQSIQPRTGYIPLITILFSSGTQTSTFNSDAFKSGKITEVELPCELLRSLATWREQDARRMAQAAVEEAARAQLREAEEVARFQLLELAEKYSVNLTKINDGVMPLIQILSKMEDRDAFQDSELSWLEDHSIYNVLATYHYRCYRSTNDPWKLVKACGYLRKSGLPEKCIEFSGQLIQKGAAGQRVLAAAHTTRGGAFRDLGDLEAAMNSANQAVDLSPNSFHPYNLLGAVHYEHGNPADGDKYFEKAIQLGAHPKAQDAEIRAALKNSAIENQKVIADYLLRKDPAKYAWASIYLNPA